MRNYLRPVAALLSLFFCVGTHAGELVGAAAPEFRLQDQQGEWHDLTQYRGKWVALYFYPKDDTPGCTTEACSFRDNIFAFDELNAVVLGVSLDDVDSHAEFAEKYSLPFSILADTEKQAADAYGVIMKIGPMTLAKRESFLINPDGIVVKHYPKVSPDSHTEEVLADLRELGAKPSEAG